MDVLIPSEENSSEDDFKPEARKEVTSQLCRAQTLCDLFTIHRTVPS